MNDSRRSLLPALLAVGTSIAAAPAAALELGEINVQSTLGQPLRASIAYALGPNEQIADYCITLKPGLANNGLPAITRADISVSNGIISLTGRSAIREPLMTLRVDVGCPYTPNLSREYMLLVDPAESVPAVAPVSQSRPSVSVTEAAAAVATSSTQAAPNAASTTPQRTMPPAETAPIDRGGRYRVQPGDSLSLIAQRIEGREIGLWDATARIFDANPEAFIDEDPNKLKAGSWLSIPDMGAGTVVVFGSTPREAAAETSELPAVSRAPAAGEIPATTDSVYEPPTASSAPVSEATEIVDDTEVLAPAESAAFEAVSETLDDAGFAELETGDLVVEDTSVVIPDTQLDAPQLADNPNVPVQNIVAPEEPPQQSINWLYWLVGGGIAIIVGLLFFGRRGREVGPPEMAAPAPQPMRRHTDQVRTLEITEEQLGLVDDDDPTEENLALDADLVMGTGLDSGIDVEVAEDFGFSGVAELDLELPDESDSTAEAPETDIIAAPVIEESSILESEILPGDDDYDMSVIVDATKMPDNQDVTERDLQAIPVEGGDTTLITDNYTVSQELDYQVLEQDYEEELSATQALNMEIERAAAELTDRLDADDDATAERLSIDENKTHELPLATVTEIDVTANLPAGEDDTAEIEANDKTVELSPKQSDDSTVEMEVESGSVDTKAG